MYVLLVNVEDCYEQLIRFNQMSSFVKLGLDPFWRATNFLPSTISH